MNILQFLNRLSLKTKQNTGAEIISLWEMSTYIVLKLLCDFRATSYHNVQGMLLRSPKSRFCFLNLADGQSPKNENLLVSPVLTNGERRLLRNDVSTS